MPGGSAAETRALDRRGITQLVVKFVASVLPGFSNSRSSHKQRKRWGKPITQEHSGRTPALIKTVAFHRLERLGIESNVFIVV